MSTFSDRAPGGDTATANSAHTSSQPAFRRVLIPVKDASQIEHVAGLARAAGASEARVLHLSLRESIGGRRYPLETKAEAAAVVEAAVLELRMAGINASGQVAYALLDRAAQAITADAAEWGADLIMLGVPRRGKLAARLFGSVSRNVLRHAPCPVLVATSADLGTGDLTPQHSHTLSATAAR